MVDQLAGLEGGRFKFGPQSSASPLVIPGPSVSHFLSLFSHCAFEVYALRTAASRL